jgi:glycosyltransferase involved in cell wall biosynthesis
VEFLDRVCYRYSPLVNPNVDQFFEDCFYVSANALEDIHTSGQSLHRPDSAMRTFSEAAQKLNYVHVLADHVYVGSTAKIEGATVINGGQSKRVSLAMKTLRYSASKHALNWQLPSFQKTTKPRHLHIIHSWGGGLLRWVEEYCRADTVHENFVLKSVGSSDSFGRELQLFRDINDATPIQKWALNPPIKGTTIAHHGYDAIFSELVNHYGIERTLVSSLIGHSLGVLRKDPPTLAICHDYYPFCPALNITFETLCKTCDRERLTVCTVSNPYNMFFHNLSPREWIDIRDAFNLKVNSAQIPLIAPAPSVVTNYAQLVPELSDHFRVIPHATRPLSTQPLPQRASPGFRVVVLGSLGPHKGLDLFKEIRNELITFADVYLVGCGAIDESVKHPKITFVPEYARADLPKVLEDIQPDLGLLLSVVPETFSYTLQELFEFGIPPLATGTGSFLDRIEDGVNGFLCEPSGGGVLRRLRQLVTEPEALSRVRRHLRESKFRTIAEMLSEYEIILESSSPSAASYFCADARGGTDITVSGSETLIDLNPDRLYLLAESDVRQLHQTIAELQDAISGVIRSRSWRITLPGRMASGLARRAIASVRRILQ